MAGAAGGFAQQPPDGSDKQSQIAALKSERDDAIQKVKAIVNQPVTRLVRVRGMQVGITQGGWFHPGAARPDFNHVDIRQTQEFPYKYPYITSDLNPGVVFVSSELEFNSMTKYFYTDRTVPKRRLTEAQMIEINRLYRIIGRCEDEVLKLEQPVDAAPAEAEPESAPVRQPIPRANYIKAGIAIAAVLVLYLLYRLILRALVHRA